MSLLSLFSFLGYKKKHIADSPGMERELWSEFTISQSSDEYEQNFSYTVKFDENSCESYLYLEVPHTEKGYPVEKNIRLKRKTTQSLMNLDITSFSDVAPSEMELEILDGTFLRFSVTDRNGNTTKKALSSEKEKEILELITPYAKRLKGE